MTGHHPVVEFFALPIEKRRLRFPDRRPGSDAEIRTGADSRRIAPPAVRGRFPSHRFHARRRDSPPFSSFSSPPPDGTSALFSRLPASPIFSNSPRFQARNRSSERHYRVPVPRPIRARRSPSGGHAVAGSRAVAPGCRPVAGRSPEGALRAGAHVGRPPEIRYFCRLSSDEQGCGGAPPPALLVTSIVRPDTYSLQPCSIPLNRSNR